MPILDAYIVWGSDDQADWVMLNTFKELGDIDVMGYQYRFVMITGGVVAYYIDGKKENN